MNSHIEFDTLSAEGDKFLEFQCSNKFWTMHVLVRYKCLELFFNIYVLIYNLIKLLFIERIIEGTFYL